MSHFARYCLFLCKLPRVRRSDQFSDAIVQNRALLSKLRLLSDFGHFWPFSSIRQFRLISIAYNLHFLFVTFQNPCEIKQKQTLCLTLYKRTYLQRRTFVNLYVYPVAIGWQREDLVIICDACLSP